MGIVWEWFLAVAGNLKKKMTLHWTVDSNTTISNDILAKKIVKIPTTTTQNKITAKKTSIEVACLWARSSPIRERWVYPGPNAVYGLFSLLGVGLMPQFGGRQFCHQTEPSNRWRSRRLNRGIGWKWRALFSLLLSPRNPESFCRMPTSVAHT